MSVYGLLARLKTKAESKRFASLQRILRMASLMYDMSKLLLLKFTMNIKPIKRPALLPVLAPVVRPPSQGFFVNVFGDFHNTMTSSVVTISRLDGLLSRFNIPLTIQNDFQNSRIHHTAKLHINC